MKRMFFGFQQIREDPREAIQSSYECLLVQQGNDRTMFLVTDRFTTMNGIFAHALQAPHDGDALLRQCRRGLCDALDGPAIGRPARAARVP